MFGRSTLGFGGFGSTNTATTLPFGASAAPNTTNSPFGASTNASTFGAPNTSNSVFGAGNNSASAPFGSTGTTSAFGGAANTGTSAFGASNTGFGLNNTSIFGQNNQASLSPFGLSTAAAPAGGSAFGASGSGTGGLFGSAPKPFGLAFGTPQNNSISPFGAAGTLAFGAGGDPLVNNGTALKPFAPYTEKDTSGTNFFQNITAMPDYLKFSQEELRLKDYADGHRFPNANAVGSLFGAGNTGLAFGGNSAFGQNSANTGSAFGGGSSAFGQNNATGSAFGQPASAFGQASNTGLAFGQNNQSTGGLFGLSNTNSSPFGAANNTNSSSGFGAGSGGFGSSNSAFGASKPSGFGSAFGANNTTSAFGSTNNNTSNAFGSSGSAFGANNNNNNTGSVFGQNNNNTSLFGNNTSGGGLFGSSNNNTTTNAFGSNNTNSAFGQNNNANSGGLFGGSSAFGAKPASTGFGATNNQQSSGFGASNTGGGLFGQNNNTNTNSGGLFGANNQNNTGGGLFGANNQANNTLGGLFGNNQANKPAATTGGLFGSKPAGTTGGLFGGGNTNTGLTFGSAQNNNTSGGLFGAKPAAPTGGGLFGGNNNNTNNTGGGLFGLNNNASASTGGGLFGSNNNNAASNNNASGGLFGAKPATSLGGGLSTGGGLFGNNNNTSNNSGGLFGGNNNNTLNNNQSNTNNTSGGLFGGLSVLGQQSQQQQQNNQQGGLNVAMLNPYGNSNLFLSISGTGQVVNNDNLPVAIAVKPQKKKTVSLASAHKIDLLFKPTRKVLAETTVEFSKPAASVPKSDSLFSASVDQAIMSSDIFAPKVDYKKLVVKGLKEPAPKLITAEEVSAHPKQVSFQLNDAQKKEEQPLVGHKPVDEVDDDGYWTSPALAELKKKPLAELRAVKDFTVGRKYYGVMKFLEPVDLSSFNLDDICGNIVVFGPKNVVVYPDDDQPKVGEGLNLPAEVTLEGCYPINKKTKLAILDPKDEVVKKHIEKLKTLQDMKFKEYDPTTGNWTFTFEHV